MEDKNYLTWEEFQDRMAGKKGTYKRWKNDREVLKLHIKDAFASHLTYPLILIPFGHMAQNFWSGLIVEGWYGTMDRMAFVYYNDAYVMPLRDGLKGKKHNYHKFWKKGTHHVDNYMRPYISKYSLKYPSWMITKIIIPQFRKVWKPWN